MKILTLGSGRTTLPVAPTLDDGSPEACAAIADYEVACTIINARVQGFQFVQLEASDFTDIDTDAAAFKAGFKQWLQDLPAISEITDPAERSVEAGGSVENGRALPTTTEMPSWTQLASRLLFLAKANVPAAIVPYVIDIVMDVGKEAVVQWTAGKLYPGVEGTFAEFNKNFRKVFLHDPGITNLERSVFKAESPNEDAFMGQLVSIGQMLYEFLYREPETGETGQQNRFNDLLNALALFGTWCVKAKVNGTETTFAAGSISGTSVE